MVRVFSRDGSMNNERGTAESLAGLKRFFDKTAKPRTDEGCDLCEVELFGEHSHIVNTASRSLMCVCRVCYLLFTHEGAAGGRYRAVPDRYIVLGADIVWDTLQIPVGVAFFFLNSSLSRVTAFYPSPVGATESLLPLDTWADIVRGHPFLEQLAPDVEALLVRRTCDRSESFIVPIDACYELVGSIRQHWRGFDGGEDARQYVDRFFARLRDRSRPPMITAESA
jgi:hypothetical protein